MSQTLEWAQPVDGLFEQTGAWTHDGTSTTATPMPATPVAFATGLATTYTVSGSGTAASIASSDDLTLGDAQGGTVSTLGALSVSAGTLTLAGTVQDADASIRAASVVMTGTDWATSGTLAVGGGGSLAIGFSDGSSLAATVSDAVGVVDGGGVVVLAEGLMGGARATWSNTNSLQIGGSSAGTVEVSYDGDGLSVGAGGIAIGAGGVLVLSGSSIAATPVTMSGGTFTVRAVEGPFGDPLDLVTVPGGIALAAGTLDTLDGSQDASSSVADGGFFAQQSFTGQISGSGTLLADDVSLIDDANTYSGGTVIEGGTVYFHSAGSAGTGPITFAPSSTATLMFGAIGGSDTVSVGAADAMIVAEGVDLLADVATGRLDFSGGTAPSTVLGGSGSVSVDGSTGGGLFYGGTLGNNRLTAGAGAATLVGGGSGDVLVAGPAGGDLLVAGPGAETLSGAAAGGADTFFGGNGPDVISTGAGTDTVSAGSGALTLMAGGPAVAFAGSGGLTFLGAGFAATVVGGGGTNVVYGGAGTLDFYAGAGGGVAYGGTAGGNLLYAGAAATTLAGAGGGDVLVSLGSGGNTLLAGPGNQTLTGSASHGNDVYFGNSGRVLIAAGTGNDTVVSGSGAQTVYAGTAGSTAVFAGSGQDTVVLGGGSDFVLGGQGNAMIYGGAGPDLYGFANGADGTAVISGFRPGTDQIQLLGYAAGTAASAVAGQIDAAGITTVTLTDNTRITLLGVASIGAGAFV